MDLHFVRRGQKVPLGKDLSFTRAVCILRFITQQSGSLWPDLADRLVKVLGLAEKVHVNSSKEYIDFAPPC